MGLFDVFKQSDTAAFKHKIEKFANSKISDIMVREVTTVTPNDSLLEAANVMIGHHFSCLVVVGENYHEPLGIITERDFLTKAPLNLEKLKSMKVKNLMTKRIVTVQSSLSVIEACDLMEKHKFRKLIVTKDKKLIGILTQHDLVKKMDEFYQSIKFRTSDSLYMSSVKMKAVTIATTTKISEAQKKMINEQTGTVFVMKDRKIVGTFTEFDLLSQLAMNPEIVQKETVEDTMSFPVVAVHAEADLFDVNHLMLEKGFRRMPIIQKGELIGKITQTTVRREGFEMLKQTLNRVRTNELEKVNFQAIKNPNELVRKVQGKVHEYKYVT